MLLLIGAIFIFHMQLAESQSLIICTNPHNATSCRLTCRTPDVTLPIIFFKMPAASQEGGCTSGGTCAVTGGRTRYTVTQNAAQNETYLDISNLVYADDDSQWVCDYGTVRSAAEQLTVSSIPHIVRFDPEPTTALSQTLGGEVFCIYPASSPSVKLVYQDGQTNQSLSMTYPVPTTAGTNGCGAHEFTITPSYSLTDTTLSGKSVRFWIEVTVAGQVIGSALTTETFVFAASRVCDDCEKPVIPLGIVGLIFVLIAAVICWLLYCQLSRKWSGPLTECAQDGDIEFTTKKLFWSTVIATVLCLLGFFLCLPGVIICGMCEEGVTTSGKVTTALILVIIGFILALIIMIVEIILLVLVCCRKIKIKGETDSTGTNQVNPKDTNVTDDEKGVKKGETTDVKNPTDVKKRTDEVEMQGIDKTQKIDSV